MDAQATVQLVFFGEVLAGFRQEDVQRELGALLKLDDDRARLLFSGARMVLKRQLPAEQAERYVAHLARLGARVQVEPAGAAAAADAPLVAPATPAAAAAAAGEVLGTAGLTQPRPAAPAGSSVQPPALTPAPMPLQPAGADEPAFAASATGAASTLPLPTAAAVTPSAHAPALSSPLAMGAPTAPGTQAEAQPGGLSLEPAAEEEQIVCPTCGERQSKRILCRNCATNMPMGIAAREEAERAEREQRLAASRAPRGQGAWPGDEAGGAAGAAEAAEAPPLLGMGFSGRMGRLQYATAGFAMLALLLLAVVGALKLIGNPVSLGVLMLVGLLLVFLYSLRVTVLRLHDVNLSGWWAVLLFLPSAASQAAPWLSLLTSVASLALMLWPGSRGDNNHGEQPRSGSWAALIGAVLVLAVAVALMMSSARDAMQRFAALGGTRGGADVERSLDEAMMQAVLPPAARSAYERDYREGPDHKAFAVSSTGAWGWWTGATSPQTAIERALAECDRRREAYAAECQVVNVNGQWGGDEE